MPSSCNAAITCYLCDGVNHGPFISANVGTNCYGYDVGVEFNLVGKTITFKSSTEFSTFNSVSSYFLACADPFNYCRYGY
jgi:hypothetical protein